jgi:hypothetical protein
MFVYSVFSELLSVISDQLSVISYQLSVISYQLSISVIRVLSYSHPEKFSPWVLTFEISQTLKDLDRNFLDNYRFSEK